MKKIQSTMWRAFVLTLVFSSVASAAMDIKLRERVGTNGPVVRLGDVAEVVGADGKPLRTLAALPLMPSPAPGTERFLAKQEIMDLLSAHGVDLREVQLLGGDRVTIVAAPVTTSKQEVINGSAVSAPMNRHAAILAGQTGTESTTALEPAVAAQLRSEVNQVIVDYLRSKSGDSATWDVKCDVSQQYLVMLSAATSAAKCQGGSEPWTGRQRFFFSFNTARGEVQVPVCADVTVTAAPIVVAVRPIARGDVLTVSHFELRSVEYMPKLNKQRSTFDSIEPLIGMEARQAIQADQIVFSDQVQSPVLVKRGDLITVSSQGGGIRVRTQARARQDGSHGQLVQVESLATRERFDARVIGLRAAAILTTSVATTNQLPQQFETARR